MSSLAKGAAARWLRRLLMLLAIACSFPVSAADGAQPGEPEIWLVTYGPGEIYWQRFGHNAIWVRDPGLGLDHVFNFGFFDFQQEDFFVRFLKGRMLYFSAARPAQEEFTSYINENRSIRAQRLDLSSDQKLVLTEHLLAEIRPENRDYLYDYYLNNCSTRVRDAIDLAMGGLLKAEFLPRPATQTWRDHTRRLTHADFWLYLGLEIGLGSPVDQTISRWDEMFIPELLAESLASLEYAGGEAGRPLVVEDVALFTSSIVSPPASPHAWWPRYLLASLIVLLAAALLCRFVGSRGAVLLARCWLVLSGAIGVVLLFFWLGTDHSVTRFNMNLLVVCPAWLLLAFWTDNEQRVLQIIAVVSSLAVALFWLPPHQYNADVLAAFIPLNLASAYGLFRYRSLSANRPDVPASADR